MKSERRQEMIAKYREMEAYAKALRQGVPYMDGILAREHDRQAHQALMEVPFKGKHPDYVDRIEAEKQIQAIAQSPGALGFTVRVSKPQIKLRI